MGYLSGGFKTNAPKHAGKIMIGSYADHRGFLNRKTAPEEVAGTFTWNWPSSFIGTMPTASQIKGAANFADSNSNPTASVGHLRLTSPQL